MRSARTVARQTTGSVSALAVALALASSFGAVGCEQPMFDSSGSGSGGDLVLAGTSSGGTPAVGGEGALPFGCNEYPVAPPAGGV